MRLGARDGELLWLPLLTSPYVPVPFLSQQILAGRGWGQSWSPGAIRGGRGQSTKGKGPLAQEGRTADLTLPLQLPTKFTAQNTPLVQRLQVELY